MFDSPFIRAFNAGAASLIDAPVLGALLRRGLVVIRYTGRRSGKSFETRSVTDAAGYGDNPRRGTRCQVVVANFLGEGGPITFVGWAGRTAPGTRSLTAMIRAAFSSQRASTRRQHRADEARTEIARPSHLLMDDGHTSGVRSWRLPWRGDCHSGFPGFGRLVQRVLEVIENEAVLAGDVQQLSPQCLALLGGRWPVPTQLCVRTVDRATRSSPSNRPARRST